MLAIFQQNKSLHVVLTSQERKRGARLRLLLNLSVSGKLLPQSHHHNPPILQGLRVLKEASVFTSGQVPCFCPGVTMKLVITTNELSPCGDTANELTASTAFSDGVSARSLALQQGVGHPNCRGMFRQMAPFSLTLGLPPSPATGQQAGSGKLQCHQPQGQWRTPLAA